MFVPLDRLYDFLNQFVDDDVIIYRFYPHGSKKLSDISMLYKYHTNWHNYTLSVPMLMHDQEPCNFDLYKNLDREEIITSLKKLRPIDVYNMLQKHNILDQMIEICKSTNLDVFNGNFLADHWFLCHSEKNSPEISNYESLGAIGIYWWHHAMVARDWYRYAKLDNKLEYSAQEFTKDFNVYSRAWKGTREYRLKFLELMVENNLVLCSSVSMSDFDNGNHYHDHIFKNLKFKTNADLSMIKLTNSDSNASADYSREDYLSSALDVVLETLFDDTRQHLTEKILRPIACGKPFILASTPGSLQYLRSYGFETFGEYIDESYDLISDPLDRLHAIIKLMKDISRLPKLEKIRLYQTLHKISRRNKMWFWSEEFAQHIIDEFKDNYRQCYHAYKSLRYGNKWLKQRKELASLSDGYRRDICSDKSARSRQDIAKLIMDIKSQDLI
jgi:hypothetical protein